MAEMFCGRSQLFEDVDLITVYFDEEDLDIMEACDSRGGVWSVELKAMCLSVMRKCLCKQKHRLPYMGEVLHALMLIDMPLAGCVQKASGVAKSGAVSVSRCSFCVDEAAGEDGLGCCPASSTLPHTSSATAASAASVSTQCAPR